MRRHGLMGALLRFRLLGSGFDDYVLPGDSADDASVYLVECRNCGSSYYSDKWVRGTCSVCGGPLKSSET